MPYVVWLLAVTAMRAAWAAPSLTTSAPIAAPTQAPASAPAASQVSLSVNTTTIMNRTPVQVKISGVNQPTQAGRSARVAETLSTVSQCCVLIRPKSVTSIYTTENRAPFADAVALYFASGDPDVSRPLKWKWAVESSPNYTTTGSGTLK